MPAAATDRRDLTLQAGFIPPCLPMTSPAPPSGDLWLHEIKLDGIRIIARNDGAQVALQPVGRGSDPTLSPDRRGNGALPAARSMAKPSSSTTAALRRSTCCDIACAMTVCASMHSISSESSGRDHRRDALADRKVDLNRLIANAGPGVRPVEWVDGGASEGPAFFEQACARGLEGIVSKRWDSRYISGRSPYWLKMENPAREAREQL